MNEETTDPWDALETAVLSLADSASFRAFLREVERLRDETERKHLGAHAMSANGRELAYYLGYVAGLNAVAKRPAQIESGEARPVARSKKKTSGGAFIPPIES